MERTKRMTTTANANLLIWPNILRRSQVLACCSSRAENTYKVATIRLLLKFQVIPDQVGDQRECQLKLLRGVARLSHDRHASPHYWLREKITSMVMSTSTGSPLRRVGC